MLKMAWYSMHLGFWKCQFQWHRFWDCTFRCFPVMGYMYALSWKLLITGVLLECLATLLKILHLKKKSQKMFHISSPIVLFSYGKVKDNFWGYESNFIWGEQKEGVRGGMGKKPKMTVIFAKFPLLSKIQILSHKLLVKQTFYHCCCHQHAQKPICRDFKVILSSSSWSKTTFFVYF